ncbi:arsenic resistance N-acetyltransferase ArsN2 [Hydrocarboniphaga sp.]|uniref:arsenic resistance N-acetyltransferase ArsN2 n=1 Tax=Hydrocarboniphaga sp. TaxID=2033016 RepID=UPI003D0E3C57
MYIEAIQDPSDAQSLLTAANLPVADILANSRLSLFGIRKDCGLVATAGIEHLSSQLGLLRSVVVKPQFRGHGFATQLVAYCEQLAKKNGMKSLYLLTNTASPFFSKQGYLHVPRAEVPAEISSTAQFSSLCPSSASLMRKELQ